ncbi:unnamed protein product [Penicillium manginii]
MPPVKLEQDTDTDAGAGADNRIVTRNRENGTSIATFPDGSTHCTNGHGGKIELSADGTVSYTNENFTHNMKVATFSRNMNVTDIEGQIIADCRHFAGVGRLSFQKDDDGSSFFTYPDGATVHADASGGGFVFTFTDSATYSVDGNGHAAFNFPSGCTYRSDGQGGFVYTNSANNTFLRNAPGIPMDTASSS